MKKFIYKTNQYLLERYPNIWNTKVVWMLAASLILHIIFFLIGFVSLTNKAILQERRAIDNFFENGTVFFGIMVSIILVVLWLINMFKNNSFKNFYPTTKLDVFKQFLLYFVILFSATTFYYSYIFGLKAYVGITYPDDELYSDIQIANDASLFLSHKISDYTVDNLAFPKPFDTLFCETEKSAINFNQPHLSFLEYKYQFFTLRKEQFFQSESIPEEYTQNVVFRKTINDSVILFYKDSLVDIVAKYGKNAEPSYFNYSETFYTSKRDKNEDNQFDSNQYITKLDYDYRNTISTIENINRNKKNYDLLKRNNPEEIKALVSNFHNVLNKHNIANNITKEAWFNSIYTPEAYTIKHLIRTHPKVPYSIQYDYEDSNATVEETARRKYYKEHITDYYIKSDNLEHVFGNLETIKTKNVFIDSIHVFMWISFCLSIIIFAFRITGLKSLLFSIIAFIVLLIIMSLFAAFVSYAGRMSNNSEEYFIAYFALCIGIIILSVTFFYGDKIKKAVSAVFLNLTITIFVPFVLLILGIITMHQNDACKAKYNTTYVYEKCFTIMDTLGIYWSYVLLIIGFVFIYFFSKRILKWKSLPEG
ncbi:hypothetical protein [Lacinutrix salivirga]